MKTITTTFTFLAAIAILFSSFTVKAQSNTKATAGGEMTFTVRTVTANGNYAPKHVLAIWIEDLSGFVKSRKVMAVQRKQYLYTWISSSNFNTVDAITGSTISSHQAHTVNWDCTDLDGNIVPDGDYVVWVEFTERHAQGPLYSIVFTKGPDPQIFVAPDETNFKDIELTFLPVVCEFSSDITEVCQSGTVTFHDESTNASSWEWDFGSNAVPATANTQGPHTVAFAYPGNSTISLTVNGSVTETKENYINVATAPMADATFSGNDFTVNFMNTSLNALTYSWDFDDGNSSTLENPVHTYAVAGTYLVSLTAINMDCEDEIFFNVSVPVVGLDENNFSESIRVFPNPNNGKFFIETTHIKDIKEIKLIDLSGQLVKTISGSISEEGMMSIDLQDAKSGIYFLEIISGTGVAVERIVIR
jgi:PKD repeat protein